MIIELFVETSDNESEQRENTTAAAAAAAPAGTLIVATARVGRIYGFVGLLLLLLLRCYLIYVRACGRAAVALVLMTLMLCPLLVMSRVDQQRGNY